MDKGVVSNLSKRARAKFVTNIVARPLSKLRSPLQKAYKLSLACAGELTEVPGKITTLYCGCRWCVVCSRIRTAKLWNGYMPAVQAMPEKWFLTLSRRNVVGAALEDEIKYYLHTARLIQRQLREQQNLQFSSLRKIECTYNEVDKTYHPHFHYIFDSWEAANATLQEWLARNSVERVGKARAALLDKGNKLVKANDESVKELFKYFTKVVSKTKSKAANGKESADYRIHLDALDRMFVAMRRVRTFQPCGVVKFVSEEIEPEQALESGREQVSHWKWKEFDWIDVDTAAALTGYMPSDGIRDIERHLVYPAGVAVAPATDLTPYYVDKETGEVLGNEYAHQCRNSMQYQKIYPMQAPLGAARGLVCNPTPAPVEFLHKPGRRAGGGTARQLCTPARVSHYHARGQVFSEIFPKRIGTGFRGQQRCKLIATPWEEIQQHSREELAKPAPPVARQLGLFAQRAAVPAAPVKLLPSPIKTPIRKKDLVTAQVAPYFQALPSDSRFCSPTG